ncbi:peroxisomal 2,4-dienoyl-CoA reductase [(3E)-enoyl-CoA-producing]-like [Tubulanus polymorphus]|uniref:peroxisomal 2,4-dienoyl-CoA reductase [(3E)-enoyl-CoA-producing]-like n=1 Tax=Tubulanus polymorphus TaxID=672921 RepID=UPI003DA495F2
MAASVLRISSAQIFGNKSFFAAARMSQSVAKRCSSASIFKDDLFKNKVALITGGGSGIGYTIAEQLMKHKCDIAIASRNLEKLKNAAKQLESTTGQKCHTIQMDVRKPEDVINAVDETLKTYNKIDYLVNNAAGNFLCPVASMSSNAFKTVMEIDTMGTFNVTKAVFDKYMQKNGGVILNISATLHYRGNVLQAHAGAAKAAIDALTKHLACEWGPLGIRVVGVAPGPIADTEGYRKLGGKQLKGEIFDMYMKNIPLQRAGKRNEIANAVLFLLSDGGSLITGETVVIDGGQNLSSPNSMFDIENIMKSNL